jgi:hypothetical protein
MSFSRRGFQPSSSSRAVSAAAGVLLRSTHRHRRGAALLVVLVVIVIVSLAAYGFTFHMRGEYQASSLMQERAQARLTALSGIEQSLALLDLPAWQRAELGLWGDQPTLYQEVALSDEAGQDALRQPDVDDLQWRFSVISPRTQVLRNRSAGSEESGLAFGLENESGKLHIPTLLVWERQSRGTIGRILGGLPGADQELIEAWLKSLDPTLSMRPESARSEVSEAWGDPSADPSDPYGQRRQVMQEGYSRQWQTRWWSLWSGGDWNQNFELDPLEQLIAAAGTPGGAASRSGRAGGGLATAGTTSGANVDTSWTADQAGNILGWQRFLTYHSGQRNVDWQGRRRVHLNQPDLEALRRELSAVWPTAWVNFTIAYRQFGPGIAWTNRGGPSGATVAASNPAPLNLLAPPQVTLVSPLDLVAKTLLIPTPSGTPLVVESPFSDDPAQAGNYLERLLDQVSVTDSPSLVGRIDINAAPTEVLAAIPQMSASAVERLVNARQASTQSVLPKVRSLSWLVTERIMSLEQLRQVEPWLCSRSDVFRAQFVGFRDDRTPLYRCRVLLDGRTLPARSSDFQDFQGWDRGFEVWQLREADELTSGIP